MTEYEYEYYSLWKRRPNTNTNTIRFEKSNRIRIRILFGLKKAAEYEYEYCSVWQNRPNMNTNIIRFEKITQIRIRILVLILNYLNNIQIPYYLLTSVTNGVHHDIVQWTTSMGSLIRILFGLKNQPHSNTNIIRVEKIDQIRIRILFGLKKSLEYEYEY